MPRALLGGERDLRPPRWQLRGGAHHRQVLEGSGGEGRGRQLEDPGHGQGDHARKNTRQAADPAQHHGLHHRRLEPPRDHPSRAMRIAEDLYMDGYISYPRTDNTVYPKSLDHQGARPSWSRSTTSRPPSSCSTGARSSPPAARRRPPTTRRSTRPRRSTRSASRRAPRRTARSTSWSRAASSPPSPRRCHRVDAGQHRDRDGSLEWRRPGRPTSCAARVVIDPGFAAIYTYARSADTEIPKLEEGQELTSRASSSRARRRRRRPGSARAS